MIDHLKEKLLELELLRDQLEMERQSATTTLERIRGFSPQIYLDIERVKREIFRLEKQPCKSERKSDSDANKNG